jgi:hypothetical protein
MSTRVVPITKLRRRYQRLGQRGVSTKHRHQECGALCADATQLVEEFQEAIREMQVYDNRKEGFYPGKGRLNPEDRDRDEGTVIVTDRLASGLVSIPKLKSYAFTYLHREVNPLRTTRGTFSDGLPATRTGKGGLDYVAMLDGSLSTPILGEIKAGSDKDPYYAFVQLLTYLSELSTEAQFERANKHLFNGKLAYPARFDLHILLADFNDRGERGPIIESTRRLVKRFRAQLSSQEKSPALGRVLCLTTTMRSFQGTLDLLWAE